MCFCACDFCLNCLKQTGHLKETWARSQCDLAAVWLGKPWPHWEHENGLIVVVVVVVVIVVVVVPSLLPLFVFTLRAKIEIYYFFYIQSFY
jgi:hypothetical protein